MDHMSKAVKNLSAQMVKRQNNQIYKHKKRIILGNYKLDIETVFRPSKIKVVIAEFMETLEQAVKDGKKIDVGIGLALSTVLVIKHFTSLVTDANGYDGLLELLTILHDGEYTDTILEAFEKEQLEKMFGELGKVLDVLNQQIDVELTKAAQ